MRTTSFFLLLLPLATSLAACQSERDAACAALLSAAPGAQTTERADVTDTKTFYSHRLETCVLVERSLTGVRMRIDDLGDQFIVGQNLFFCDRDGVDAAILDSVRAYHGLVHEVSYRHWLDDGQGGPPRALQAPDTPYSEATCQRALDEYLEGIE